MVVINRTNVKNMYYANLLYELHTVEEKIAFYAKKYKMTFDDFERHVNNLQKENFGKWDDFLEWRAYEKMREKYEREKEDLERGNYKVSGRK